ncbi:MAG: Fic family protein [Gammaproteobacteria bacterium]|nr:Fic family protein [Gammaproteobacteria bacterium]MDE0251980.1 Fic family protein [Gammaproteobacteria bacterium]MDE0402912.1 Fic family protein [Gammaproteobacteria bacterium]
MVVQYEIRSGRYEHQTEGYRAFVPAALPPDPPIKFDGNLLSALSRADQALGNLNGAIRTLPEPQLFVSMYVRQEALLSSRIEGTQSSLQELLEAEAQLFGNDRYSDAYEVVNYIAATQLGLKQIENNSITIQLIQDVHHELLQNTRGSHLTPGEFRTNQVWIGPAGCRIQEAEFIPPPPNQIELHMKALTDFIDQNDEFPLLVKVALVHSQFETIHPFRDGNGRIGRLLMTLILCKAKVLEHPVLYLSWFFNRHRTTYYEKLQSVRDDGSWEDWLIFCLRAVEEVSNHAATTAQYILAMREGDRNTINENFGRTAANGHLLLDSLYEFPSTSINEVKALTGISYASAKLLVDRMIDSGLLREYTGYSRNKRYVLFRYLDLFDDM